jgi:uncharacterized protein (UPF0276 family)
MAVDTILSANLPASRFSRSPLPQRAGVGLKPQHVDDILKNDADIGFFEIHAENYMGAGGIPHAQLRAIREKYPVSLHGVGMSIGGTDAIDPGHLARFKALVDYYQPAMVSEHLAWSTHDDVFYNDLLPVPYTNETLTRVVEHIDQVQTTIKRPILIENPSTYLTFDESTWVEFEFMSELARRSGCGLLFDVNNVFVSATNHGYSPENYIDSYPLHKVEQIHLAGHANDTDDDGAALLIDAHDREVCNDVWTLYERTLSITGPLPSLIEWDNDVPTWAVLAEEAEKAELLLAAISRKVKVA